MTCRLTSCKAIAILTIALPAAWADQSGTVTLAPNTFLNLDSGATSGTGGDILWTGIELIPQNRAELYNLGKYGARAFKSIQTRHASAARFSSTPIPAATLVPGDVFGVRSNSGRFAKMLVTAAASGSLSLQYTIFSLAGSGAMVSAAASSTGPQITEIQNNYSYIVPGLPNYGIAPGSIFVIIGTGLSTPAPPALQSSGGPGLPKTLNQTSVSVTVNGVTTTPALYYTSATQLAAVLPSPTPVGTGTLAVSYNGQTSAAVPIQVVPSAIGLDTLYGTGNGAAVVTDNNGIPFNLTNSATPGQTVILWGSGLGADTSNNDTTYPQTQNNLTNIPVQIYIGGISANVIYRGRSQYPGLDQYNVTIPSNVSPGCYVSVVAQTGSVVSNAVTLPVTSSGGGCSDPATGLNGGTLQTLADKTGGNVNSMAVLVNQVIEPNGNATSSGFALAGVLNSADYGKGYEYASQGSCTIVPPAQGTFTNLLQSPLDAGAIQMTGPTGQLNLAEQGVGFYQSQLPAALSSSPGTYTFTASGGANVGSFKVSINVQSPISLTNRPALATITRSQGATVTWSGGFPNGDVQFEGAVGNQTGTVRFYCHAPSSAGQITVPASILLALPAGGGSLDVTNTTAVQTISAPGLDLGLAAGAVIFGLDTTFK